MLALGIKQPVFEVENIEWHDVVEYCDDICQKIHKEQDNIDAIVGISRGGLIPAVIIAQMLKVRDVYSIGVKSYNDNDRNPGDLDCYQCLDKKTVKRFNKNNNTVLFVDDISDRGKTFRYLSNVTKISDKRMCSLFIKGTSTCIPRYYSTVKDSWVVFPWEDRKC